MATPAIQKIQELSAALLQARAEQVKELALGVRQNLSVFDEKALCEYCASLLRDESGIVQGLPRLKSDKLST